MIIIHSNRTCRASLTLLSISSINSQQWFNFSFITCKKNIRISLSSFKHFSHHAFITVKCRTIIKAFFLYLNLCLSVMLDSHYVNLHPYPFVLNEFFILSSVSTIFQLYHGCQFYWWRKPKKTTDQPQVNDEHHHIMLCQVHLAMSRIRTHNISGDRHRLHM